MDKDNYKKDRTVCKSRYKKKENTKVTPLSKVNNHSTKILKLTILIEHFWLVLVFGVKHFLC